MVESKKPGSNARYQRTWQGTVHHLAEIREFVSNSVSACGGSQEDIFCAELATDEAASNIFVHAYSGQPGKLQLAIWRADADLLIELTHWGRAFDPDQIPDPDVSAPLEERQTGGLGLYFIRSMMAEVTWSFDAQKGNVMRMRRVLGQTSA